MPTQQEVQGILDEVSEQILQQGAPIQVTGHRLDDGWLTVVLEPTQANIRASEYADLMSAIERRLREEGVDEVVLVPALAE